MTSDPQRPRGTASGGRAVTSTAAGTAARRAAKEAADPRPRRSPGGAAGRTSAPEFDRDLDPGSEPDQGARHHTTDSELPHGVVSALEEQREFLLASLQDLDREHEAGDVDDVDYEALKDDYTARAAAVIRRIESHQARFVRAQAGRRRGPGRAIAAVVGLLALGILAGVGVAQTSGRRDAGDLVQSDAAQSSRDLLLTAKGQVAQGQVFEAIKTYDKVLEVQPSNSEALTYKGWLLNRTAASGAGGRLEDSDAGALRDRARQSLDRAVQSDPEYPDARIFRAIIFSEEGRTAEAIAELERVKDDQVPAFMQDQVAQLRQQLSTGTTTARTG